MTISSVPDVVVTSPQQRRVVALGRVAALTSALDGGWTLLRLHVSADAAAFARALDRVRRDEIFAIELVTPAGARTPFQTVGDGLHTEILVDARTEDGLAWARRLIAGRRAPGILLAAAQAGADGWWLLVQAGCTHMDLGSVFEVARRIVDDLAVGPVHPEAMDGASYLDAADALDELAEAAGDDPAVTPGRMQMASGDAPRSVRTLRLDRRIVDGFIRLGQRLGVGWDAAALAAWTRVILMRGDRSGACALGIDGRTGDLAPILGPLAWSTAFVTTDPDAVSLRGMAALAEGAIRNARAAVVPAAGDGREPLVWTHGFETLDMKASPPQVALIGSTMVVEPAVVTLRVTTGPDWYDLTLVYDSNRIDEGTVEVLSERLADLAETTDYDVALRRLSVTVAADRLLADAVNLGVEGPSASSDSVGDRLTALATTHPDAPAIATAEGEVSYAALLDQARRVAAVLAENGIGQGGSVGVALARGATLYATLCGILSSGAHYVPIDPDTPIERLEQLARAGGFDLMIAVPAIAAAARSWGLRSIAADDWNVAIETAAVPAYPIPSALPVSNPAYMIYTSGTTGGPKGVVISNGALINYADAIAKRLGTGLGTRMAALSTYAADLSYTALWGGLLTGGCVCCLPSDAVLDAAKLSDAMRRFRVDWLKIVPAHWQALAASADHAVLDGMIPRIGLVFGGDVLPASTVTALRSVRADLRIVNHYGPTETTVGAIANEVQFDVPVGEGQGDIVPIGIPLANMQALVADLRGNETDLGNDGMLLIGGPGVANGYRGAPGLTADRFRPSRYGPFGTRVYRTGDRTRRLPDGAIAFLGRTDDQLKLRGFRVEPQEVANAIRAVSDVRDVAVVADADVQTLLAFVVPHPLGVDTEALLRRLPLLLPAHAIPREIHAARRLPLTRNGKVDRLALLDMATALQDRRVVLPRTPVESAIAEIWREALGMPSVGVDENFFALGGHSLLATQILARIRQRLAVDISIADFFACPTIEGLAGRAVAASGGHGLTLEPRSATAPNLLSLGQERLWFLTRTGDNPAAYNNAYAFSVRGPFDAERFGRAVSAVVERHVALRMGVVEREGAAFATVVTSSTLVPDVHDLTSLTPATRDETIARLLSEAASAPFDLSSPPLLRVQVLRTGIDSAVVGLVVHHIVWDGWSNALFTREVFDSYVADDGSVPAPPLTLDYLDHVAAERRWAQSPAADEQLGYWTARLASIPALDLTGAAPVGGAGAGELSFTIPREIVNGLQARAAAQGATEFMALLTAYFAALWRECGQTSFAVGTSVSNRNSAATESMIGYFVNQIALCADLKGNPTMATLLERVRSDAVAAFSSSTMPFGTIVSRLRLERAAGRTPVFQTMLVRQAGAAAPVRVGDLAVEPVMQGDVQARFDVTLYIGDRPDGLTGTFVYDTAVLAADAIDRLRDGFLAAARLIAAEPDAHLSQLGRRATASPTDLPPADRQRFVPGARRTKASAGAAGNKE